MPNLRSPKQFSPPLYITLNTLPQAHQQ